MAKIWTEKQVRNLQERQECMTLHPYTCSGAHESTNLIPTEEGWVCPKCDYTQDWAHISDLNGDFRQLLNAYERWLK